MLELQGIAVSPGVAFGRALVFDREGYRITRCLVKPGEYETEWSRLIEAVSVAKTKLESNQQSTAASLGAHLGESSPPSSRFFWILISSRSLRILFAKSPIRPSMRSVKSLLATPLRFANLQAVFSRSEPMTFAMSSDCCLSI